MSLALFLTQCLTEQSKAECESLSFMGHEYDSNHSMINGQVNLLGTILKEDFDTVFDTVYSLMKTK